MNYSPEWDEILSLTEKMRCCLFIKSGASQRGWGGGIICASHALIMTSDSDDDVINHTVSFLLVGKAANCVFDITVSDEITVLTVM